jgi:hypothetical protein
MTRSYIAMSTSLFLCSLALAGSDPLVPFRVGRKAGFIDRTGKVRIEPAFHFNHLDSAYEFFVEGLQPVQIGDYLGYIDETGTTVIEPQYTLASPFSEGLAMVRAQNGKWGYVDRTGEYAVAPVFDRARRFSSGLALVVLNHQAGYINKHGSFVIPPTQAFRPFGDFEDGLARVTVSNKCGFISTNGQFRILPRFDRAADFSEGVASAREGEGIRAAGYINANGQFVIGPEFFKAWRFSEGLARVETELGRMQFIDLSGRTAFEVDDGAWAGAFSEGLVNICQGKRMTDGKWGYMNTQGKWMIPPRYQQADPFKNGIARVHIDGKRTYIDKTAKIIWQYSPTKDSTVPPEGAPSDVQ